MGAGLAIFVLCVLVSIPLFIASGWCFLRYKKASANELQDLKSKGIKARSLRAGLFALYGIAFLFFYYEFWLTLFEKLTGLDDEPGIIYHFLDGIMSWDNLHDILVYWSVLTGIFLFGFLLAWILKHKIRLVDTNNYAASVYLVGLYPVIVLSFIGWAGSWEPQKRFYKSDDILINFGYSNKAIDQQLGTERVELLQSIMSWADTYDIPNEWLPRNLLKLDSLKRLRFHTCRKNPPLRLPETLGELDSLRSISITQCYLETVPASITRLGELRALALRRNNIEKLPDGLSQLTNLTLLDFRANRLNRVGEEIGDLGKLTELNLSGNKIRKLPESLAKLKNLTNLYLSHNELTELPEFIGHLPNLRKLDIYRNQITHIPDSVLELLKKRQLKYFSFADNPLSDEEISRIETNVDKSFTSYYWNRH